MRKATVSYQQGCLYREKRKASPEVWAFRFRDGRSNRKVIVGSVQKFRTKAEAMKARESLRSTINRDTRSPQNVAELVNHYTEKELSDDSAKAHSTQQMYRSYIRTWIMPQWGEHALCDVRTVAVENWLRMLPLANASRAKIRSIMHALYNHAMRFEWMDKNPISLVRQSAKRERVPDVLTVGEISALLGGAAGTVQDGGVSGYCHGPSNLRASGPEVERRALRNYGDSALPSHR